MHRRRAAQMSNNHTLEQTVSYRVPNGTPSILQVTQTECQLCKLRPAISQRLNHTKECKQCTASQMTHRVMRSHKELRVLRRKITTPDQQPGNIFNSSIWIVVRWAVASDPSLAYCHQARNLHQTGTVKACQMMEKYQRKPAQQLNTADTWARKPQLRCADCATYAVVGMAMHYDWPL